MDGNRKRIILVDDNMANLDQGRNILRTFYEVFPAPSAKKLFEILEKVRPELILLDIDMPQVSGYDALKKLKSDERFSDIPVIFLTAKTDAESELEGFDLGAVDYVTKPFSAPLLLKRIEKELVFASQTKDLVENRKKLTNYVENLETMVAEKVDAITNLQNAVLTTMTDLVEFRDKYTGGHIMRTRLYLQALVSELIKENVYGDTIARWDIETLLSSAQLHDVGKIAVSDSILNKPGKLTDEEFDIIKGHVMAGVDAIERIIIRTTEHAFLSHALAITGTHHEKWDGTGYPIGLKGNNIPLEGRLMAIADVYDALISARPYKNPMPHEDACAIIENGSGTHFDPSLLEIFAHVKDEFFRIAQEVESVGDRDYLS
jgi:putative two-component system response regulator